MLPLERIPDQVGYLLLTEDGAVISSGGELENCENVANIISGLISLTDKFGPDDESYKKLSITFKDCSYIVCLSNKKIYVVKKRFDSPPEILNDENVSPSQPNNAVSA